MRALVSGQASVAVLVDGESIFSITLDHTTPVRRMPWEVPLILADVADVFEIANASIESATSELEAAWCRDRAFRLTLVALDSAYGRRVREDSIECLEELLAQETALEFVANRMYAAPIPASTDLDGVRRLLGKTSARRVSDFLETLISDQAAVRDRRGAWDQLPDHLFGGAAERELLRVAAVEAGAFRAFVAHRDRGDWALFQMLAHQRFRGDPTARAIFQAWAKPFRASVVGREFAFEADTSMKDAQGSTSRRAQSRRLKPHEAFQSAERQRAGIKDLLIKGNYDLALRFVDQLVRSQRDNSEARHVAMSLCDLAQFAKQLGDIELQRDLSERASREDPTDPWPLIQFGDAHRQLGQFELAQDAFYRAGVCGDESSALLGRAEVLKDLGQVEDALKVYDRCSVLDPTDIVSRNARAAALAAFGRLEEALASYDAILNGIAYDPVTLGGKAQVLRDLGQTTQALALLDEVANAFPADGITQQMRAEVLRDLGRYKEALAILDRLISQEAVNISPRNSRARILKEMGAFEAAANEYRRILADFPKNATAFVGLAEVLRRAGEIGASLEAYRAAFERFPWIANIRTGLAALLTSQGHYAEALRLLPTELPATQADWVGYHIRSMVHLRSNDFSKAAPMLEWGVLKAPWAGHKRYFESALASLRIRERMFGAALELLKAPPTAALMPLTNALRLHAYAAMGRADEGKALDLEWQQFAPPPVLRLYSAVEQVYSSGGVGVSADSEDWLLQQECDMILMAA